MRTGPSNTAAAERPKGRECAFWGLDAVSEVTELHFIFTDDSHTTSHSCGLFLGRLGGKHVRLNRVPLVNSRRKLNQRIIPACQSVSGANQPQLDTRGRRVPRPVANVVPAAWVFTSDGTSARSGSILGQDSRNSRAWTSGQRPPLVSDTGRGCFCSQQQRPLTRATDTSRTFVRAQGNTRVPSWALDAANRVTLCVAVCLFVLIIVCFSI